jgi:hypothetical protein
MRKLPLLAFAAAMSASPLALAQDSLITVDLSGISEELATQLDVDIDDVPETIELSADLAAAVCGVEVATLEDSCVAIAATTDLIAEIESDDEGDDASANSAREFAPGQQDGPAKDFAPGQQEGDAKDHAPGQMKKSADDDGAESSED